MTEIIHYGKYQNNWLRIYDSNTNKFYYWNSNTKQSLWQLAESDNIPIKIEFKTQSKRNYINAPCESCKGIGLNLVHRITKLCNHCMKDQRKVLSFGPCISCKGYGKDLVSEDGLCSFCRRINPSKGASFLEKTIEIPIPKQEKAKEIEKLKSKKLQDFEKLILETQKAEKSESEYLEKFDMTTVNAELLLKRKKADLSIKRFDPLDPEGKLKRKGADVLASLTKAADETATGTLFQSRPYPNPGKVMKEMSKKTKML